MASAAVQQRIRQATPVLMLDFDGTLSPIVGEPDQARLPAPTRRVLEALAEEVPVAVVSGRGLEDLRERAGLSGVFYVGSHGFEAQIPPGVRKEHAGAKRCLEALDEGQAELEERLSSIEGALVERKRFSIAVHDRKVQAGKLDHVERIVHEVNRAHGGLRVGAGKRVHELQPDLDWDKGRAIYWLLSHLGLSRGGHVPIYVGDDDTDEDAFKALEEGIPVLVENGDERSTHARYVLEGPSSVREFLERVHHLHREGPGGDG